MSTGFQFFEGSRSESTAPAIRLRRTGQMVFNRAALELLGEGVTHVQVGFNAASRAVGIRPAPEGARGRYRLRKQGRSGRLVDSRRFFAHLEVEIPKALSFAVESFGEGLVGFTLPAAEKAAVEAPEAIPGEAIPGEKQAAPARRTAKARSVRKAA